MARVTVEDCVDKVPNRFELVMLASHRAREISSGSPLTVDRDNDKNPVVSLREIADETQSGEEDKEVESLEGIPSDIHLLSAGSSGRRRGRRIRGKEKIQMFTSSTISILLNHLCVETNE